MNDDLISRKETLKPYKGLDDADAISVWLIRKNIEQQPSVNTQEPKFIAKSDGTIEPIKNCSDCEIVQACIEAGIRSTSRALDILDKIRAEIEHQERWLMYAGYNAYNIDMAFSSIKLLIDKYKIESEEEK